MTPKEKAKELIKKFTEPTKVPNIKKVWVEDLDAAKQCALICVDELILSTTPDNNPRPKNRMDREFWQEVKSEIEKL